MHNRFTPVPDGDFVGIRSGTLDDLVREAEAERQARAQLLAENPEDFPRIYASTCTGTCLEPELYDGCTLVFDKEAECHQGDFVALWFKPGAVPRGMLPRIVKRLALGLMPGLRFPYVPHPRSELKPLVVVMTLNPERQFTVPVESILCMHRCIGEAAPAGVGRATMTSRFAEGGIRVPLLGDGQ